MKNVENKKIFADNLAHYMAARKINAKELSRALDEPYSTVLSWKNAEYYPRIEKIEKVAKYFGVFKSDLIENKADIPSIESPVKLSEPHKRIIEITKTLTEPEAYQVLQTLTLIVKGLRK